MAPPSATEMAGAPPPEAIRALEPPAAGPQEPQQVAADKSTTARAGAERQLDANQLNARKQGEWAVVREFAVANYDPADTGARRDFRETIFWSPSVKTDAQGKARIEFPTSDSITSFRIVAEGVGGGAAGHGETQIASKLPLAIAANLPVEVTTGDRVTLPVTITNNSGKAVQAVVQANVTGAMRVAGTAERSVWIPARAVRTVNYQVDVKGTESGDIEIIARGGNVQDALRRTLRIVPNGFPAAQSFGGTLAGTSKHTLTLPAGLVAGSARTTIKLYPTPVATMTAAVDSIVREPSGCFEQASSSNYPNVMVMAYLSSQGQTQSQIAVDASAKLDKGYQLLTGYESKTKGFEWFGGDPGHEALSAYGLLQFREMSKVYPNLDPTLVGRTAAWLKSRRDGKGGYQRNAAAIDTFGRANADVTDAYITYALAESGERDLTAEIARARQHAKAHKDPYVLALSAGALLAANPADSDGDAALARLVKMQAKDGKFTGADHSITRSGGQSLEIETTALAALAMMKSKNEAYRPHVASALKWLTSQRSQWGGYGSTQATILSLKALTANANANRVPSGTRVDVLVNGTTVAETTIQADGDGGAIELPDIGAKLRAGDNVIELRAPANVKLDYSLGATWYDRTPASSAAAPVAVTTTLDRSAVRVGGAVKLTAKLANVTDKGQPMTMARVGLPGGLKFQPWQLDELVKKHTVDFVETREREVILYFRQMKPRERRTVPIQLLAQVPGHYVAPPSSAYLYYTDEHRHYQRPLSVDVMPPLPPAPKKKPTTTPAGGKQ